MILKHNPKLQPGKMFIHHILFETEGEDIKYQGQQKNPLKIFFKAYLFHPVLMLIYSM